MGAADRGSVGARPGPVVLRETSPWIDVRFYGPIDPVLADLEAQTHRHFVKSHLPADGLPYFSHVKYLVVGRGTRDVFMSLWNRYSSYTQADVLVAE